MKTVVALYDHLEDAHDAVDELVDTGFSRDDISLVARDVTGEYGTYLEEYDEAEDVGEAAAGGAVGGAVVGGLMGLLVGIGAFAIPGLGPVIAAGPVAASLAGAGIGAATGGVLGALIEWGVPEAEAGYYAEGVRRGGTLLSVRVPETRVNDVVDILNDHDPVNVERRAEYWRSEYDWSGYDADADPYDADEISTYRSRLSDWDDDYESGTERSYVRSYMGSTTNEVPTWQQLERGYRDDFDVNYAGSTYTWNQYSPAYRFGYDLATDPRYADRSWEEIEADAESRWTREFDGAWDEFAGAVEYGWEQVKDALGIGAFEAGVEDSGDEYAHRR